MIIYHVAVSTASTGNIAIDDAGKYGAARVLQNTLQKLVKKHSVKISTSGFRPAVLTFPTWKSLSQLIKAASHIRIVCSFNQKEDEILQRPFQR